MDLDTLKMIVERIPEMHTEVTPILRAGDNAYRQRKLNRVAAKALGLREWTNEEKFRIAAMIDMTVNQNRDVEIRLRATEDERDEIKLLAEEEGMTMSNYIRQKIGLDVA